MSERTAVEKPDGAFEQDAGQSRDDKGDRNGDEDRGADVVRHGQLHDIRRIGASIMNSPGHVDDAHRPNVIASRSQSARAPNRRSIRRTASESRNKRPPAVNASNRRGGGGPTAASLSVKVLSALLDQAARRLRTSEFRFGASVSIALSLGGRCRRDLRGQGRLNLFFHGWSVSASSRCRSSVVRLVELTKHVGDGGQSKAGQLLRPKGDRRLQCAPQPVVGADLGEVVTRRRACSRQRNGIQLHAGSASSATLTMTTP